MKDLYNLACSLTALPSVSGFEEMAFPGLEKICEGRFDEIKTLPTGSFIGIKRCGKANAERLLLDAHLDQIGFVVSGYAGEGFLKVAAVGGIDTRVLCANEVWIYGDGGKIPGVFSSVPPHLRGSGDSKKPIKLEDLCVSTYLEEDELKEKVRIGTPVGFKCTPELLANDRMASVQLDDKICIAAILRAIDLIKDEHLACDIYALFAGGEEIGYKGAVTGGWDIDPHYAIALDVGGAAGPDSPAWRQDCRIGDGGIISYSATLDRAFTKRIIGEAEKNGIKYKLIGEPTRTGTDSMVLATVREGVTAALISIPLRNMHTYTEVISLHDVEETAKLLAAVIKSLGKDDVNV